MKKTISLIAILASMILAFCACSGGGGGGGQGADAGSTQEIYLGANTTVTVGSADTILPVRGALSLKSGLITVRASNTSASAKMIDLQVKDGTTYLTVLKTMVPANSDLTVNTFMRVYTAISNFTLKNSAADTSGITLEVSDQLWIMVD